MIPCLNNGEFCLPPIQSGGNGLHSLQYPLYVGLHRYAEFPFLTIHASYYDFVTHYATMEPFVHIVW